MPFAKSYAQKGPTFHRSAGDGSNQYGSKGGGGGQSPGTRERERKGLPPTKEQLPRKGDTLSLPGGETGVVVSAPLPVSDSREKGHYVRLKTPDGKTATYYRAPGSNKLVPKDKTPADLLKD